MKNNILKLLFIPLSISLLSAFNNIENDNLNKNYELSEEEITKIEVDTSNMKTEYLVNENFSIEGGKLDIYDKNNNVTSLDLTSEMIEDYPSLATPRSDYPVYVSYLNKYTSFNINVLDTYKMSPQINVYITTDAKINNKDHDNKVILKNKDNIEYSSTLSYEIEVEVIPSSIQYEVTYYTENKTNEYNSEPLYNGQCLVEVITEETDNFRSCTKDITYYLSINPEFSFTYGDKRTPLTNGMEFYKDYLPSFYTLSKYIDCQFETYFSKNDGTVILDELPNEVGTYAINCKSTNESHKYSDIGQFRWFKIVEGTPEATYYDSASINFFNNAKIDEAYQNIKVHEKNKEVALDPTSDISWMISYGAKTTDAANFQIGNCKTPDYGYSSDLTVLESSITSETDTTSDNYKIAQALNYAGSSIALYTIYSTSYISNINDIHFYWTACESGGYIRMLYNLEGSSTWNLIKRDDGENATSVSNPGSGVSKSFNRYAYDNYLTMCPELKGKNARIAFTYEAYNVNSNYIYLSLGGIRINSVSSCYNFANYIGTNEEQYNKLVNLNNGYLKSTLEANIALLTDNEIEALKNMPIYVFSTDYGSYYDYLSFLASKCGIEGYTDPLMGNTNAPTLITKLKSLEQLNEVVSNSVRPSNMIVKVNENIDVIDENNLMINDLNSIYQTLNEYNILTIIDVTNCSIDLINNLKSYLVEHKNIIDIAFLSDNSSHLLTLRSVSMSRGIYYVNSFDKIIDAVQIANKSKCQTIMIDSNLASYDVVRNYTYMFKSVFIMNDDNNGELDLFKSISLPINGIVTSSYLSFHSFYSSLDKNTLFGSTLNIAHRGANGYHENSISSSLKAIEEGATHLELDIYSTLDNELVLSHDNNIERTTNGTGNIEEMTLEEIKQYKLDEFDYLEDIPTLGELLDAISETDVILVLEIKGNKYGLGEAITNTLKEYNMNHKTVVISFNIDFLGGIKSNDPEIPLLWLNAPNQENYYTANKGLDYVSSNNVGFDISIEKATSSYVTFLKNRGFYIGTWTYVTLEEMNKAFSNGLYALTNDDCSLLGTNIYSYEVISVNENEATIKLITLNKSEVNITAQVENKIESASSTFYLLSIIYNSYKIYLNYSI